MSRFLEIFLLSGLKTMGWPRPKGIFRRQHVDSLVADEVVEQGLNVIVGLGAGRPEVATRMLADTFSGNPWTEESISILLEGLGRAQDTVASRPEMTPWKALWHEHRLALYTQDIRWSDLFDDRLGLIRAMASSRAAYWGLTNEHRMQEIFDGEKLDYEENAAEANQYGLGVSNTFPFNSLEHFYESCDTFIDTFNTVMPPLHPIPPQLMAAPEIARRLSA